MNTRTEQLQIRQGDVLIQQVHTLPAGCTEIPPEQHDEGHRIVLARGEATGHAHAIYDFELIMLAYEITDAVITRAQAKARLWRAPAGGRYLEVLESVTLRHEEHTPHTLLPGIYHLPVQVEYSPDATRRVLD